MEVVLLKDIPGTGTRGEVKKVSDGYARNYLFPHKLARLATSSAKAEMENMLAVARNTDKRKRKEFETVSEKLRNLPLSFSGKANKEGTLFKGINADEIINKINSLYSIKVGKEMLKLEAPIKKIGKHTASIYLNKKRISITIDVINK